MNIPFSDTVLTLTRYDRSLVKFYPYKDNDTYYIECYMIKKAYMTDNYADIQNVNIKLYSKELLTTLVFDLTNVNKIVFYDATELDLTAFSVIPVNRDYYSNITKETPVKDSISIVNVYQYGYFEFNLVNLDVREEL